MRSMDTRNKALYDCCLDLAGSVKWQRSPFPADEITKLAQTYYDLVIKSSKINGIYEQEGDLELFCGIVEIIHQSIPGPHITNEPVEWFISAFEALLYLLDSSLTISSRHQKKYIEALQNSVGKALKNEES